MFSLVFSLPRILYCSFIFCIWTTHTIVNSLVSPHQNHRYIPIISVSSIIKVILFKSFPVMSGSRLIAFACFAFSLISHHLPHTSWHSLFWGKNMELLPTHFMRFPLIWVKSSILFLSFSYTHKKGNDKDALNYFGEFYPIMQYH